jgi:hypothetical protein
VTGDSVAKPVDSTSRVDSTGQAADSTPMARDSVAVQE